MRSFHMKKSFLSFALSFLLLLTAVLSSGCGGARYGGEINRLDAEVSLLTEYSRNFADWSALSAETELFKTKIFASGARETVYLRIKNTADVPVRLSVGVGNVYGVGVPDALRFSTVFYPQGTVADDAFVSHLPLQDGVSEARVLDVGEDVCLALSVVCDEETHSVVAPALGVLLFASSMPFSFDRTDAEQYVMKEGKDLSEIIPRDILRVRVADHAEPLGMATDDLSLGNNGAVVGWREGDTYIISTRRTGQKAILNRMSSHVFAGCESLIEADLAMLDTSRVLDFMRFFYSCKNLASLDLSSFDTSKTVRMRSMFSGCSSLCEIVGLSSWEVDALKDTAFMFSGTGKLSSVDLSSWNMSSVIYSTAMFQNTGASALALPDSLSVMGSMFLNHAQHYSGAEFRLPSALAQAGRAHFLYNFGTDALQAYTVDKDNKTVKTLDGILYSADGTLLLAIPKGKRFSDGIYEIPEGVTLLGELSFSRNPYVETVVLPNSYRVSVYTKTHHEDFADKNGTGNINVGNSLNLATYVFSGVRAFAVKADNPVYCAHEGVLYTKDASGNAETLLAIPVGITGELCVPEGVTSWDVQALWEDDDVLYQHLQAIHIPASLSHIAEGQLMKINALGATVTVSPENSVYAVDEEGKLYIK